MVATIVHKSLVLLFQFCLVFETVFKIWHRSQSARVVLPSSARPSRSSSRPGDCSSLGSPVPSPSAPSRLSGQKDKDTSVGVMGSSSSNHVWKMTRESAKKESSSLSNSIQGDTWAGGTTPMGRAVGCLVESRSDGRASQQRSFPNASGLTRERMLAFLSWNTPSIKLKPLSHNASVRSWCNFHSPVFRPVWTTTSFMLSLRTKEPHWRVFSSLRISTAACVTNSAMNPNSGCSCRPFHFNTCRLSPSDAFITYRTTLVTMLTAKARSDADGL